MWEGFARDMRTQSRHREETFISSLRADDEGDESFSEVQVTKEHVEERWKARDPEEQTGTGKQKCRKCKVKAVATRFAKSFARPSSRLKMIFHEDLKMESMIYSPHNGPSSRTQSAVWPHSACMAS